MQLNRTVENVLLAYLQMSSLLTVFLFALQEGQHGEYANDTICCIDMGAKELSVHPNNIL